MLFLSSWCVHIWRKGNYLRVLSIPFLYPESTIFVLFYLLFVLFSFYIKKFVCFLRPPF